MLYMSSLNRIIHFYSKNDFENYKSFKKYYKKKMIYDEQFIQWFIGFYEHTHRMEIYTPRYMMYPKLRIYNLEHELCRFETLFDKSFCEFDNNCICNLHSYFTISKTKYIILERLWVKKILDKYLSLIFPDELITLISKYIAVDDNSVLDLVMYKWILSNHLEKYIPDNYSNLQYLFNLKKIN